MYIDIDVAIDIHMHTHTFISRLLANMTEPVSCVADKCEVSGMCWRLCEVELFSDVDCLRRQVAHLYAFVCMYMYIEI